jgi:hypothetical protein
MLPIVRHRLSSSDSSNDYLPVMVFPIFQHQESGSDYLFALPVEAVIKVMKCPANLAGFNQGISMISVDNQMITVVDLCYRLMPERTVLPVDRQFLMLIQTHSAEPFAIPVANFPVLLHLPVTSAQPIPAAYRQVNSIGFASHMAIIELETGKPPAQVFLMGMNHLLVQKLSLLINQQHPPTLNETLN